MAVSAQSIIDKAVIVLNDAAFVHWTLPELCGWINSAQLDLLKHVPGSLSERRSITLVAGQALQTIPSDCYYLLSLERIAGGNALRPVAKETLDARPNWFNQAGVPTVYAYNPDVPANFYVFKQPTVDTAVEAVFALRPVDIPSNGSGDLTVTDPYANAVLDYVLFRAFSKDAENAESGRAMFHYQAYAAAAGLATGGK
jgi:hypothetical protein